MRDRQSVICFALIATFVVLMIVRGNNIANKMEVWKKCTDSKSCDAARLAYTNAGNFIFTEK